MWAIAAHVARQPRPPALHRLPRGLSGGTPGPPRWGPTIRCVRHGEMQSREKAGMTAGKGGLWGPRGTRHMPRRWLCKGTTGTPGTHGGSARETGPARSLSAHGGAHPSQERRTGVLGAHTRSQRWRGAGGQRLESGGRELAELRVPCDQPCARGRPEGGGQPAEDTGHGRARPRGGPGWSSRVPSGSGEPAARFLLSCRCTDKAARTEGEARRGGEGDRGTLRRSQVKRLKSLSTDHIADHAITLLLFSV